jgi:5-methylcytosine-specific restriction endonuclease McrA
MVQHSEGPKDRRTEGPKDRRTEGNFLYDDIMEVDHIIPRAKGGQDIYTNLQLLHRHCHDLKTHFD